MAHWWRRFQDTHGLRQEIIRWGMDGHIRNLPDLPLRFASPPPPPQSQPTKTPVNT